MKNVSGMRVMCAPVVIGKLGYWEMV